MLQFKRLLTLSIHSLFSRLLCTFSGTSFRYQQPMRSEAAFIDEDTRYSLQGEDAQDKFGWIPYSGEDSQASAASNQSASTAQITTDFASTSLSFASPFSLNYITCLNGQTQESVVIGTATSPEIPALKEPDSRRQTFADLTSVFSHRKISEIQTSRFVSHPQYNSHVPSLVQDEVAESCYEAARSPTSPEGPLSVIQNSNHTSMNEQTIHNHAEDTAFADETANLIQNHDLDGEERVDDYTTDDSLAQHENPSTLGIDQNHLLHLIDPNKRNRRYIPKNKTRKRQCDNSTWIDVKAKKARVASEAGIGRKNRPIQPKSMDVDSCGPLCPMKCMHRLTLNARRRNFEAWYKLESTQLQWEALCNWIFWKNVETGTTTPPTSDSESSESDTGISKKGRRYRKLTYNRPDEDGKLVPVCQKMFLKTLDISYRRVKTALKKKRDSGPTGIIDGDKRGKHTLNRRNKIPESVKDTARRHIESFPTMESHYCREKSSKNYLDESIESLSMMYTLNVEEAKKNGIQKIVSEHIYQDIFNNEYNYEFFMPEKDRCEKCETYKFLSDEEKVKQKDNMRKHREEIKAARKLMNESDDLAKTGPSKVLSTPRAEISTFHYMSKICIWNFTIYEFGSNQGYCFVGNESIGNRGSNEIASYLIDYPREAKKKRKKSVHIYSDNCGGQKRNKNVFASEVRASVELKIDIRHRFLEVGHIQAPGDSVHAMIEEKARLGDIYSQAQWCHVMRNAKRENPLYIVTEKTQDEIYEFTSLASLFKWDDVKIPTIKEFAVKALQPGLAFCRYKDDEKVTKITKRDTSTGDILNCPIVRAYDSKLPLSEREENDIKSMMDKGIIVGENISWYNTLLRVPHIPRRRNA
ncbi:hypothetical protein QAD02_012583 [Eretmocerus hayati]|uniref:Uncharacterized protein n=1 Tax=Eretmocerus hayati TaxID=131215 RepID=A0ACC2P1U3_9HYME|nr:hypothetical protein QAD02_012583 [Eretmocerus hayati]